MPLIHLSEEQVHSIVRRATALNVAFPGSAHGMKVGDPDDFRRVTNYRSSREARALIEAIRSLSDDARHELIALMWLGRGDSSDDFLALVEQARSNANIGNTNYITEKAPSLPSYLRRGLARLMSTSEIRPVSSVMSSRLPGSGRELAEMPGFFGAQCEQEKRGR